MGYWKDVDLMLSDAMTTVVYLCIACSPAVYRVEL